MNMQAIKQGQVTQMDTLAEVIVNNQRIEQIRFVPTGECMKEAYTCEFIATDLLSHSKPVEFFLEKDAIVILCDSGIFSFQVVCEKDILNKLSRYITCGSFYMMKEGYGFSLNS